MSNKKISIIMPVYNGEAYLKQAIDSIIGQTYVNFEYIIINDCSTDKSKEIIQSYSDSRIIYSENEKNLGVAKTLNIGIKKSNGDYIARMDADDISLPTRLEKQANFLENNKNVGIVGTNAKIIDTNGKFINFYIRPIGHRAIKWTALFSSPLIHPSVMSRSIILKKFNYQKNFINCEDYELWSRLLFTSDVIFANLNEFLIHYRVHSESVTQLAIKENNKKKSVLVSLGNIKKYKKLTPTEEKHYLEYRLGKNIKLKSIYYFLKLQKNLQKIFADKEKLNSTEVMVIKKIVSKGYLFLAKRYLKKFIK
ncbi:MAG: glycosyltransferase [Patescibacteria group bacterium]|jgi:glycosyltransferase involved in cell wall biosynthesis